MDVELRAVNDPNQPNSDYPEETDPQYIKHRLRLTTWVRRFGILVILVSIAQIVLAILHALIHPATLAKGLIASGIVFLLAAISAIHWAGEANKAYKGTTELFHPKVNDRLTRSLFVQGLLLVGLAVFLIVNIVVQKDYTTDFVEAKHTTPRSWQRWYHERAQEGIIDYLRAAFIAQLTFLGIQALYFGFAARTAFRCLKWDNRTMSYLVFLGNTLVLIFSLGVVYLATHALGYGDYPQVKAHFPMWNVRALIGIGILLAVVSLIGFLADHRSWRIGFLVVGFLLVFLLLLLTNFTGFAFKHTRGTYKYYKGIPNIDTCTNRMYLVNLVDLDNYGCPRKYLDEGNCTTNQLVDQWEAVNDSDVNESSETSDASDQQVTATTTNDQGGVTTVNKNGQATTTTSTDDQGTVTTTTQSPQGATTTSNTQPGGTTTVTTTNPGLFYGDIPAYNYVRNLANAVDEDATDDGKTGRSRCLNPRCCGLLGQLYSDDLLRLANFGLLTILAGLLSTIGCFYFWYVSWIDATRNKKRDFVWLAVMLFTIVGFLVLLVAVHPSYPSEKTGTGSRHLSMI